MVQYLVEYIQRERPASVSPWVADDLYNKIAEAARRVGTEKLKPIFVALGERIGYEQISLVRAHLILKTH